MKHGSLFSGIGGFDLAAQWMGWENTFHCEWMDFPRKVLEYYWPEADSYIDITKTNFKKHEGKVDIITGGFPCQPFSMAGKRKGSSDERYLWDEMLRAIQEVKPKYVIAENVYGLTNIEGGLVFEKVWSDLEVAGYEVQPFVIGACAKNAPHRRDRVWFIAYSNGFGNRGKCEQSSNSCKQGRSSETNKGKRDEREQQFICDPTSEGNATNTNSDGFNKCDSNNEINSSQRGINAFSNSKQIPTNFEEFPTQSPICGRNDGLPRRLDGITFSKWRNESIKGYGNAITPPVAYELFKVIEEIDRKL